MGQYPLVASFGRQWHMLICILPLLMLHLCCSWHDVFMAPSLACVGFIIACALLSSCALLVRSHPCTVYRYCCSRARR